jgi:hypothetical protein
MPAIVDAPDPVSQPDALLARLSRAAAHDDARVDAAIQDFFLAEPDRLDDRVRGRMSALLSGTVEAIEQDILSFASRLTGTTLPGGVFDRLVASGLLRDRALVAHLIGVARLDLAAEGLVAGIPQTDRSDLLVRLCSVRDGVVASAAATLLAAINRMRADGRDGLPAALYERVVWWVAAALHEKAPGGPASAAALVEAATRSLDAQDEAATIPALAMRLAAAIDARTDELGTLLIDTLADARPTLFVAVLAHAARLTSQEAMAITLDLPGDRLWVTLRALGLDRATIARVGLLLSEADPRRDVDAFADLLDTVMAVDAGSAAAAIGVLRLHPDFRAAQRALGRAPA